jgi:transposase
MSGKRYAEEFKIAAVKQLAQRWLPTSEIAKRLGISAHSLRVWAKLYGLHGDQKAEGDICSDQMRRLIADLERVTTERNILKRAAECSGKTPNIKI